MKRTTIAMCAVFLLAGAALFGQTFAVNYLDGTVELQSNKVWKALNIGDKVPADGVVRVSQSGSVELQRGTVRLSILKDGTYDLASLAKSLEKDGTGAPGNSITQKLQSIVTEKPKSGAVGGVRGAAQGTGGSVMWVDENEETRSRVQSLLDQKKYTDALKAVNEALADAGSDSDIDELTYLQAAAYYGAGQAARAYRSLVKVTAQPSAAWYARYIILQSQVLVDTLNFKDALAVLDPFVASYPTGEATQMAYLLTFFAQKGLGDMTAAAAALDAGYKLDTATDTAKLIDAQKKALK